VRGRLIEGRLKRRKVGEVLSLNNKRKERERGSEKKGAPGEDLAGI